MNIYYRIDNSPKIVYPCRKLFNKGIIAMISYDTILMIRCLIRNHGTVNVITPPGEDDLFGVTIDHFCEYTENVRFCKDGVPLKKAFPWSKLDVVPTQEVS